MHAFIRPEISHFLKFHRGWLLPLFIGLVLLWIAFGSDTRALTVKVMAILGALTAFYLTVTSALQKRLILREAGIGLVEIEEGQVTYFGIYSGTSIDLADLESVQLYRDEESFALKYWVLKTHAGVSLSIPAGARGIDQLIETLCALEGFQIHRALKPATRGGLESFWTKP